MKKAELLDKLLAEAQKSRLGLRKLNLILHRVIPFNRPHRIKISQVSDDEVRTYLPYRKNNLNHLKGIHACALATLAEYTSGIYLLQKAGPAGYRIIMKSLHVEYHAQARSSVSAVFGMTGAEYSERVADPLSREGQVMDHFAVEVYDEEKLHIATATMEWQLKDWKKTKSGSANKV